MSSSMIWQNVEEWIQSKMSFTQISNHWFDYSSMQIDGCDVLPHGSKKKKSSSSIAAVMMTENEVNFISNYGNDGRLRWRLQRRITSCKWLISLECRIYVPLVIKLTISRWVFSSSPSRFRNFYHEYTHTHFSTNFFTGCVFRVPKDSFSTFIFLFIFFS